MQKEKFCSLLLPSMCFSLVTDTSNDPPVDKRHMHIHALPTSSFLDCYIYLSLLRGEKIKRLTTHPSVSAPRPAAFFFFSPSMSWITHTVTKWQAETPGESHFLPAELLCPSLWTGTMISELRLIWSCTMGSKEALAVDFSWWKIRCIVSNWLIKGPSSQKIYLFNSRYLWISNLS